MNSVPETPVLLQETGGQENFASSSLVVIFPKSGQTLGVDVTALAGEPVVLTGEDPLTASLKDIIAGGTDNLEFLGVTALGAYLVIRGVKHVFGGKKP